MNKVEHCFCDQLSDELLLAGRVCQWCKQADLKAKGLIKYVEYIPTREKENEMGTKPAFLRKMEQALQGEFNAVMNEIEMESDEVEKVEQQIDALESNGLRISTSFSGSQEVLNWLIANKSEAMPAVASLMEKLSDADRVRKAGKGNAWKSNVSAAELDEFIEAAEAVGLKNTVQRIRKQIASSGI
jgi:polyhydroxyalkanoate synthesis regulator phasin